MIRLDQDFVDNEEFAMGDKNPKNKAKDQKRKNQDKEDSARKSQEAKDAKATGTPKPGAKK